MAARILFSAALVTALLFAADTARLSGIIRDQQGAVIPAAQVAVVNKATGLRRTASSSATGEYQVLELPIGTYRIEVEAPGFRRYVQSGITLSVNQSARNDVGLSVGELAQEVTVAEAASMIDTSISEVKHTVDAGRMKEIPLAGRNVMALASLMPGIVTTSMPDGVGGSQTRLFINGNRYAHNMFQLDGADFTGMA